MTLSDDAARARIRDDHATSLIAVASAGTGKTTALIDRAVAMLCAGSAELSRMLVVTFTERAAGELTLRLRQALEAARKRAESGSVELGRIEQALRELETARIGTIHGVCADLLRERPVEAAVDPGFTVLAEDEQQALFARIVGEVLEREHDQPEGIRRVLLRRRNPREDDPPRERVIGALRSLADQREHRGAWRRDPFDRAQAIDEVLAVCMEVRAAARRASRRDDYLLEAIRPLADLADLADLTARSAHPSERDLDAMEAAICNTSLPQWKIRRKGSGKYFGAGLPRDEVVALRDRGWAALEAFRARADADLAACLRADLWPLLDRYEALKRRSGALDFLDLLLRTRALLLENPSGRAELRARFTHVFVDEVQDVDPVQADIVVLLAATGDGPDPRGGALVPGKLFLVGDPKQSIYRFRRADLSTYLGLERELMERGVERVHLTACFRCAPAIADVVNRAFERAMGAGSEIQPPYSPLVATREGDSRRPQVIALGIPQPYSDRGNVTQDAVTASTPDVVAAFLSWMLFDSGWRVVDPQSRKEVAIAPRHIGLLFKRKVDGHKESDIVRPYVEALEDRDVPHVWVGGSSFHQREEVFALRAVAAAIEYPDDTLAVYATLRGIFFGWSDADLLVYRDRVGALSPMRRVDPDGLEPRLAPIAKALALLRELHLSRNRVPIAETMSRFLAASRAHAVLALAHAGEQVLATALRVVDLARRSDQRGALSFRAFVSLLEDHAEHNRPLEASSGEEGQDGVRVMTVHAAKGLELPVIVLCDPAAPGSGWADRWLDRERDTFYEPIAKLRPIELIEREAEATAANHAELIRLLYVAATRARDLLIVPACGDEQVDGWLSVLGPALYPQRARWRAGEPAPGCPRFGDESILDRPASTPVIPGSSVKPGLYPELGVVWWDPRTLAISVAPREGLRSEEMLRSEPSIDDGQRAHVDWAEARLQGIEDASVPSLIVESARAVARRPSPIEVEVPVIVLGPGRSTASDPRARALFRAVLAYAASGAQEIEALASMRARSMGAEREEVEAVVEALSRVMAQPWWNDERAVRVRGRDDRGAVVHGTIDVLTREGARALARRLSWAPPTTADRIEIAMLARALSELRRCEVNAQVVVVG